MSSITYSERIKIETFLEIRNLDLLEKTKRRMTQHHSHQHQRLLGRSIEERPKRVEMRHEFGHFEIDTVIGKRAGSESVLLTFTERKTRYLWLMHAKYYG